MLWTNDPVKKKLNIRFLEVLPVVTLFTQINFIIFIFTIRLDNFALFF